MLAAVYEEAGPDATLTVREVPRPEPGPGEVRVKVAVSGVNPTDWKSRKRAGAPLAGPFQIPNQDGAGTIDAVGAGVSSDRIGERVWLLMAAKDNVWGTAAEFCVVPAERAVRLADGATWELGASLGVPALTASYCLNAGGAGAGAVAGRTVLVSGGAGAVGHAAIELARFEGAAQVIATVSGEAKAELARAAGAHTVVNYRDLDAVEQIRAAAPGGVDIFVEVALDQNLELDLAVAAAGASICSYAARDESVAKLPVRRLMASSIVLRFMLLYVVPADDLRGAINRTQSAVAAGAMTTLPLVRFPLERAQEAHDAVELGAVGKVLIDLT